MPFISRTQLASYDTHRALAESRKDEIRQLENQIKELKPTDPAPVHTWKIFLKNGDKILVKATHWGNATSSLWDAFTYGRHSHGIETIISDYAFYNGKQLVAEFQKDHVIAVTRQEQDPS